MYKDPLKMQLWDFGTINNSHRSSERCAGSGRGSCVHQAHCKFLEWTPVPLGVTGEVAMAAGDGSSLLSSKTEHPLYHVEVLTECPV